MPLHYDLIVHDSTVFLCIFPVESVFITNSFHLAPAFPTLASCRDWRDSHRLSPAWTRSQRQTSVCDTYTDQEVCVRLFHHLMGSEGSPDTPSRASGLFGLFPRHHVSHLAVGFSLNLAVGSSSFYWLPAHLTSGTLFSPTHMDACVHIML